MSKFYNRFKVFLNLDFLLISFLLLLGLYARFYLLPQEAIWLDEAYSLDFASKDGPLELVKGVVGSNDPHPPLYYLVLQFWQGIFGVSEFAVRSLSLLFFLLAIIFTYLFSLNFSRQTAFFSSLLVATLFFSVSYAQEVRMYSLFLFLLSLSLFMQFSILKSFVIKKAFIYSAVLVLLLYTHHYAILWVSFLLLYWLLNKPLFKEWLFVVLATFLLYLPGLTYLFKQFLVLSSDKNETFVAWLEMPNPSYEIFDITFQQFFFYQYLSNEYLGYLACGIGLLVILAPIFIYFSRRKKSLKLGNLGVFFLLGFMINLLLPYIISVFITPVIDARYMQGSFLLMIFLIAYLIARLPWKSVYIGCVVLALIYSFTIYAKVEDKLFRPDWNAVFDEQEIGFAQSDTYTYPSYYTLSLDYHMKKRGFSKTSKVLNPSNLEELQGDVIFIERLSLPNLVLAIKDQCDFLGNAQYNRIGYYKFVCK